MDVFFFSKEFWENLIIVDPLKALNHLLTDRSIKINLFFKEYFVYTMVFFAIYYLKFFNNKPFSIIG